MTTELEQHKNMQDHYYHQMAVLVRNYNNHLASTRFSSATRVEHDNGPGLIPSATY